jgi:hypothetical protein
MRFSYSTVISLLAGLLLIGFLRCTEKDEPKKGGCPWNGNCSGKAPEGAYDCSGNAIVKCVDGRWEHVISCGTVQNGNGYYCTCKGGCGIDYTECSYAFDVCAGQSYETCGANANAVITTSWDCQ